MQVRVHAVGYLKKYTKEPPQSVQVTITPETTARVLLSNLGIPEGEVLRVAVNEQIVDFDYVLQDGDEVRIIPPIAGG